MKNYQLIYFILNVYKTRRLKLGKYEAQYDKENSKVKVFRKTDLLNEYDVDKNELSVFDIDKEAKTYNTKAINFMSGIFNSNVSRI